MPAYLAQHCLGFLLFDSFQPLVAGAFRRFECSTLYLHKVHNSHKVASCFLSPFRLILNYQNQILKT